MALQFTSTAPPNKILKET